MSFKRPALIAATACIFSHALLAQEVRRAIPVAPAAPAEPPTAPAVPFDFDKPAATPAPAPVPAATPVPNTLPQPTPLPAATAAPTVIPMEAADKQQLDYANGLYGKKIYDMAIPEYEKYVALYPHGPDLEMVYFRLAESYRASGSINSAKANYELLLSTFSAGDFIGPAAYRLGDIYFQAKSYEMALPMFRRAAVRLMDKAVVNSAKFFTARCLENLGSFNDARQTYEDLANVAESNPFRDASRLSLAHLLTDAGKKVEAHKQYELIAKETDKPEVRIEALVKASLLKIDLGENDKAAGDFQKALQAPEIGPWKDVARMGLLHAWYEGGKYKELADYFAANTKDFSVDTLPEALLLAGNSQRKLGNSKAALPLYDQVIKKYPDSPSAKEAQYQRLVGLYYADDPALVKSIDDYLAQNPASEKRGQVTLLKAESFYRKQKFAEAIPVYASLDASSGLTDDLRGDAQFKLGWCQMQVKAYTDAITSFTAFLALYPKNKLIPSALTQRAVASQKNGDLAGALKDFNQLITDFPKAKERELALQQKALILGQRDDNQAMSETFQKLLKEYPETSGAAQANYWIGWAAFNAKKYKEAIGPLDAARKADKEQFEKATLYIMTSYLYLEDRDKLAAEVDAYPKNGVKIKIPAQILRWLGAQFLTDKNYEQSEKYLTMLTARTDEALPDDWLDLGHSLANQHRDEEAVKAFSKYLEGAKDPIPRSTGLLALGDAQLSLGKYDDAQKSVDEACSLQPEGKLNAEGRILSGEIQVARGEYEKGAKLFLSVSVLLDDPVITPHAMELAIDALKKAGKDADAAKVLNDLQTRYAEYVQQKKSGK